MCIMYTVEPPLTATAESPYIHFCFNLSTTVTSQQGQKPLKHVPTAKKTSSQRQVNQGLTNGIHVYKTPFYIVKGHET